MSPTSCVSHCVSLTVSLTAQGEPLSPMDGAHVMGDGAAHDALLNANIHLLTFLAGIPNAGPGLLLPPEEQVRFTPRELRALPFCAAE